MPEENENTNTLPLTQFEGKATQLTLQQFDNTTPLTSAQIDKIIEQNNIIYSYIHQERMQEFEKFKVDSSNFKYYITAILIFLAILGGYVTYAAPTYLSEFAALIVGLFGGTGIGYGLKRVQSKGSEE
jgi:hypothetical protein